MKAVVSTEASQVLTVSVASVRPYAGQPRTYFDRERLRELAASIKEFGQQVPIIVRRLVPPDGTHEFEIIDGDRRHRAHQIAKLPTIRVVVGGAKDEEHQFVQSVVANFGREAHTPGETARAVARVVAMPEYASLPAVQRWERVGALFARSDVWVQNHLRLSKLPHEVIALVDGTPDGKRLNAQVALQLDMLADREAIVSVAKDIVDRDLKPAQARLLIRRTADEVGRAPGRERQRPAQDANRAFTAVVKIKQCAESVLDMPQRGLRQSLEGRAHARKELLERIDDAQRVLAELRQSIESIPVIRAPEVHA